MSLKKKSIRGVFWSLINLILTRGASFFATVLLARILTPEDFGLLGMIMIFMGIGTTLLNSGLSQSLIRANDVDEIDYATVFYTNIGISIFVYILIFILAPYVSVFYEIEILTIIIRVYSIGFLISATSSIQTAILTKEMEFKKITGYQIPATVISIFSGIFLAMLDYGVWSLVWMFLINQLIRSIVFWYKSKWKPALVFDVKKLQKHFNFGYKLMLSGLINTAYNNIYNVIFGKYYALNILGFYERSFTFQHYITATITETISNVSYPLLSKIQDDRQKMIEVFKKIIKITFFILCPIMLGIIPISNSLFEFLLGEKWIGAVPFFKILCLSGILYPLHFLNINLLKVLGRSDLFLKIEIYKKLVGVSLILLLFRFGIDGLLASILITSFIGFFINTYYTQKLIGYGAIKQILDLLPTFILSIISTGVIFYFSNILRDFNLILQILIPLFMGAFFFISSSLILKLSPVIEILNLKKTLYK